MVYSIVCERLFLEPDTITCDDAVVLAIQIEAATKEAKVMKDKVAASEQQNFWNIQQAAGAAVNYHANRKKPSRSQMCCEQETSGCLNCGWTVHLSGKTCPAKGEPCHKKNHLARCCHSPDWRGWRTSMRDSQLHGGGLHQSLQFDSIG